MADPWPDRPIAVRITSGYWTFSHFINFTVPDFRNYYVLATPYGAELIITINGSQLVKLQPFLLNMQVRTLDSLHKLKKY